MIDASAHDTRHNTERFASGWLWTMLTQRREKPRLVEERLVDVTKGERTRRDLTRRMCCRASLPDTARCARPLPRAEGRGALAHSRTAALRSRCARRVHTRADPITASRRAASAEALTSRTRARWHGACVALAVRRSLMLAAACTPFFLAPSALADDARIEPSRRGYGWQTLITDAAAGMSAIALGTEDMNVPALSVGSAVAIAGYPMIPSDTAGLRVVPLAFGALPMAGAVAVDAAVLARKSATPARTGHLHLEPSRAGWRL
jgi:hypothetical protein